MAEEDVLGDRQPVDQVELLVDRGDAEPHGGDRGWRARPARPPADLARVGLVGPGEHLDERGLAGAVLAEQAVHLAGATLQVDAVQRPDAGERLDDAAHASSGGSVPDEAIGLLGVVRGHAGAERQWSQLRGPWTRVLDAGENMWSLMSRAAPTTPAVPARARTARSGGCRSPAAADWR